MVGHIDYGGSVGRSLINDVEFVVLGQGIGYERSHSPREGVVAVGRIHLKFDVRLISLHNIVNLVLPSGGSAVQTVHHIVCRKLVLVAVDDQPAEAYSVGISSDGCSEIAGMILGEVIVHIVEAQNNVLELSVAVRNHNRDYTASEIGDAHLHSSLIHKCIESSGLAIILSLEIIRIQTGFQCFGTARHKKCN